MSKKTYGIGVIGCGVIWDGGHWGGLKEMSGEAQVRYVYDVDEALTKKAAEKTGAKPLCDPDEMFQADDVDIITLATPPFARADYVEKACAAGKHLMIEKPMSRTLQDALSIFRAVRKSGTKCFVPFGRAVNKVWRDAVEIIQSGELGDPLAFVHTNLGTPYPWVSLDHWMHNQEQSGGPVFDYSIHFIEMARACLGSEAATVYYGAAATTGRVKSDDQATLLIEYESGAFGEFTKSWSFPPGVKTSHQATHVVCRDAVVTLDTSVEIHTSEGSSELKPDPEAPNGRAESYRNLIAAIEGDAALHASELEGLRTIEILCTALKSGQTGRKEKVTLHG